MPRRPGLLPPLPFAEVSEDVVVLLLLPLPLRDLCEKLVLRGRVRRQVMSNEQIQWNWHDLSHRIMLNTYKYPTNKTSNKYHKCHQKTIQRSCVGVGGNGVNGSEVAWISIWPKVAPDTSMPQYKQAGQQMVFDGAGRPKAGKILD